MMTDLRRIDLNGNPRTPGRKADRPELAWVEIDRLVIDDSYQRPLGKSNWANIKKIAGAFDWNRFTPILVSRRDGGLFAIVDGQHRAHAAALRGFDAVPAMVTRMTPAEEARAFAWVNGQVTAITVFHVYKAALAAWEPWAMDCREAVEAAGCRLMTSNSSAAMKRPREIYPIGLIRKHVEVGRGEMVTAALDAIVKSEGGAHAAYYGDPVLNPLFAALAELEDWRAVDLPAFLEQHDLLGLRDDVETMQRNRPRLDREPTSKVYRQTLLALLKKHVSEVA